MERIIRSPFEVKKTGVVLADGSIPIDHKYWLGYTHFSRSGNKFHFYSDKASVGYTLFNNVQYIKLRKIHGAIFGELLRFK